MYPNEYIDYLAHFHSSRDYFECHEILEDYWKYTDPGNKNSIWVGLILLAVSCYHHRRGNFNGALRTIEKAIEIFDSEPKLLIELGLDQQLFRQLLLNQRLAIKANKAYSSINLPIHDSELLERCKAAVKEQGGTWGIESDLTNNSRVHRHKLRDRTAVIEQRVRALKEKAGSE